MARALRSLPWNREYLQRERAMRAWALWVLTGIGLALGILLGTCIIGLARLSPTFGRRLAGSAFAVAALAAFLDIAITISQPRGD
jgi:hypothetical protein